MYWVYGLNRNSGEKVTFSEFIMSGQGSSGYHFLKVDLKKFREKGDNLWIWSITKNEVLMSYLWMIWTGKKGLYARWVICQSQEIYRIPRDEHVTEGKCKSNIYLKCGWWLCCCRIGSKRLKVSIFLKITFETLLFLVTWQISYYPIF